MLAGLAKHARANLLCRKEYERHGERVRDERRIYRGGQIGALANPHGSGRKCRPKRREFSEERASRLTEVKVVLTVN